MNEDKIKNSLKDSAVFLKHAVSKPLQVGYLFPSSSFLIRRIARSAQLDRAARVIELGPGTGGTTKGLLSAMPQEAELITVEINKKFVEHIKKTIDDERLIISDRGAEHLKTIMREAGWQAADVVISGIPFSTLPKGLDQKIIDSIHAALKPGGLFVAYQLRDRVSQLATPVFGKPRIQMEYKNMPPMRIFIWHKRDDAGVAGA